MTLYRLCLGRRIGQTGYVTDEALSEYLVDVSTMFPGFTVLSAVGMWKGQTEESTILEIISQGDDESDIVTIAERYCERFSQESVLTYSLPVSARFVSPVNA